MALFLLRGAPHTGVIRTKKRISFQNILCYNKIHGKSFAGQTVRAAGAGRKEGARYGVQ